MKLTKLFIIFFILTLSFIACRKTKLQVTEPVFPKEYEGYSYVGNYGNIVGIYGKGDEYKLVIEGLGDATLKSNQKGAVDKIYGIIGKEGVGNIMKAFENYDKYNSNLSDIADKISKNAGVSDDKKDEIKNLIEENFQDGFKFNPKN